MHTICDITANATRLPPNFFGLPFGIVSTISNKHKKQFNTIHLNQTMAENTHVCLDGSTELAPRTGTSLLLKQNQRLRIIDPLGKQVSDLAAYNAADIRETLSNGRTFDYAGKIYLTTGDKLYSNRSNPLLSIVEDTVGRHDFLMTPCSSDTFRLRYPDQEPHHGCFGNLAFALERYGIEKDGIPSPFNCFMNVPVDGVTGKMRIEAPLSKAGDYVDFVAEMDLIVAITACSAPRSNDGVMKPIRYRVFDA
jgi:uncharacterized protein YcgI (DUF1989 family)